MTLGTRAKTTSSLRTRLMSLAVVALLAAGCDGDGGGGGGGGGEGGGDPTVDAGGAGGGAGGEGGAGGAGGEGGGAPPEREVFARTSGRMTINQLRRSIPVVTDGLIWEEDFGAGPTDMLAILAATMGQPDYLRVTEENLEPTLIIAKFMQDASQRICPRWVERDRGLPLAERTLVRHEPWDDLTEAPVRESLRALLLRVHSRHVAPDTDDAGLDALHALFVNASSTAAADRAATDGWTAICIALLTDPEFILY